MRTRKSGCHGADDVNLPRHHLQSSVHSLHRPGGYNKDGRGLDVDEKPNVPPVQRLICLTGFKCSRENETLRMTRPKPSGNLPTQCILCGLKSITSQ